jgi:hypothetical protein
MIALLAAAALATADAQTHHHQHTPRLGQLIFKSSCMPAAQAALVQGLEWLHSFEYARAEQQFSAAAAADPGCGIAYWGVAMSSYHPLWAAPTAGELQKGMVAIAKAREIGAHSERENDYIGALGVFYRGAPAVNHRTRVFAYSAAMADLRRKYPADNEAAVFYALSLIAAGTLDNDRSFARQKAAAGLLNQVLAAEPDHPGVSHYLIHSFDYPPLANLALPAARRYAGVAPDSAHAQHMPSHIFTRLGLWDESIKSNQAAEAAALNYERSSGMAGAWDQQLHAMDYLAYAYLQTGRDAELASLIDRLNLVRQADPPSPTAAYAVTAIPARAVLERRRWSDAARLELPVGLKSLTALSNYKWAIGNIHFARAMGAARNGDLARARAEIAELAALEQALAIPPGEYDWRKQIAIERQIAEAWLAKAELREADAERIMRAAADLDDATEKHPVTPGAILPAREQLGELLFDLNRPADALKEYEASLTRAPRRLAGLYGAARAAQRARQNVAARHYYAELLETTEGGDPALIEVKEAQAFAARHIRR